MSGIEKRDLDWVISVAPDSHFSPGEENPERYGGNHGDTTKDIDGQVLRSYDASMDEGIDSQIENQEEVEDDVIVKPLLRISSPPIIDHSLHDLVLKDFQLPCLLSRVCDGVEELRARSSIFNGDKHCADRIAFVQHLRFDPRRPMVTRDPPLRAGDELPASGSKIYSLDAFQDEVVTRV